MDDLQRTRELADHIGAYETFVFSLKLIIAAAATILILLAYFLV